MVDWKAEQKERVVAQKGQRSELKCRDGEIDNLDFAIANRGGPAALPSALEDAEA